MSVLELEFDVLWCGYVPVYFYKRNETFYFPRAILSDFSHRSNKRKINVQRRTDVHYYYPGLLGLISTQLMQALGVVESTSKITFATSAGAICHFSP